MREESEAAKKGGEGSPYEAMMAGRARERSQRRTGKVVLWPEDREWYEGRQGKLKYFLNDYFYGDACLSGWLALTQEIKVSSGKHRHQGGVSIFALEGKGRTTMDEESYDWEAGDLVVLPVRERGVAHQHFNERDDGLPSYWFAFVNLFMATRAGDDSEQIADRGGVGVV